MRHVLLALICACVTAHSWAANYFVRFESAELRVEKMSVRLGEMELGPVPIGKYGGASFGPVAVPLPSLAVAQWQMPDGQFRTETIDLGSKLPFSFTAVKFQVRVDGGMSVFFIVRIGGWRDVEIPLNESTGAAAQRELNEALHIAAGRGQIDAVKDAVEKGADVNYLFRSIYPSPVRYASNGQHRDVVDYLLSKGARVTKRDLVSPYLSGRMKELGMDAE